MYPTKIAHNPCDDSDTLSSSSCSAFKRKSQTFGFCANAADSRAVLSVSGRARRLSVDHTAESGDERDRIVRAGGRVEFGRLADEDGDGVLKVSRGIGNFDLEPSFICEPFMSDPVLLSFEEEGGSISRSKRRISDVVTEEEEEEEHLCSRSGGNDRVEFLLLASDGLWDVFEDQDAVDFVLARLREGDSAEVCASRLTNAALERQSKDDTTVVLYVINEDLVVVPTRYDSAAVTSMPSMPQSRSLSSGAGAGGPHNPLARNSSRSVPSGSIVSADGGIVFASTAGYVLQNEKVSPPSDCVMRGLDSRSSKTPQRDQYSGAGKWYARPPKSKKHKKSKGNQFHLRREQDLDDDEEFL